MLRKLKYIVPLALVFAISSCSKSSFDINVDPNNPANLPAKNLLPGIEKTLGDASASIGGISETLEVYMHRITCREAPNAYGVTGNSGFVDNVWIPYLSSGITNANIIIANAVPVNNFQYAGIAKLLKAFMFSQLVDIFGDIPFTEEGKLTEQILNPKFDDDATIYPALITMINDGIADLNNPAVNVLKPGSDDLIYGGQVPKWIKMANTLKLKLYVQQWKVKDVKADVMALLAKPETLISQTSENFQLPYSVDNKNPGYADYSAAQRTKDISPWFYEIMKGYNQNIFTDITDPRIPYYWFNQLTPDQVATNDGFKTEYRDGPFVSIYFGSNGPNSGFAQQNTQTVAGIYPVGGKYDDKSGSGNATANKLTATSATGAAPYRFITYADRLYLEAEMINVGQIPGDARAKTLAAIKESFNQVDAVVSLTGAAGVPKIVGVGNSPDSAYYAKVMTQYDNASTTKQLEIIMTQKWISSFGSAIDAYTDYRRTGFPVLFNPNATGVAQPPIDGDPTLPSQPSVKVSANRDFPLSLPWPSAELNSNSNAPAQKQPSTYKVFWQP
ncbi:MAG: SusD/RagB family nutrient-binding outer membrane lipoprotein [Ginsengibacter sp.]